MKRIAGVSLGMFSALTLGLVLLLLGVVTLFGITEIERGEALRQIPRDRSRLERRALTKLFEELRAQHDARDKEIDVALHDPYASGAELLMMEGERVLLPRLLRPTGPIQHRPAGALPDEPPREIQLDAVMTLLERDTPVSAPGADYFWTQAERERISLAKQAASSPAQYEAWLLHRARNRMATFVEITTTLLVLEQLDRKATARDPMGLDAKLATALLRDGIDLPEGRVEALFALFLFGDDPLPWRSDVWVRTRVLARRYAVRVDDVDGQVGYGRPNNRPTPEALRARTARARARKAREERHYDCADGHCLVIAFDGDRVRGTYVGLSALESQLLKDGRADGNLPQDASVDVVNTDGEPSVVIKSKHWEYAERLATERFVYKASGLGVVALLGIGVFVMAIMLQRRRTAYIELRGQLVSAVTHELKTPLASISALAQTLEMRYGEEPQARDYATRIVTSADRLGYLVDNVLSFTRLERGAWKPRFETIHPSELETLLAEPIARAARPVDLTLHVDDVPFVADRELVRLMLSNLVDNAAKYAIADRVAITVSLRTADKTTLHFSDDGPGLGERDPRQLFDDFRRGKVDDVRGTGLGLSICRWVASLHGGTIAVEKTSTAGTTFVVTLAKRKPAPPQATRRP